MPDRARTIESRKARIAMMFELFNAEQFDVMLSAYADDVAFVLPESGDGPLRAGAGKQEIRPIIAAFRARYGRLHIVDAFAAGDQVSVVAETQGGDRLNFAIETTNQSIVRSIFVFGMTPARNTRPDPAPISAGSP